MSTMSTSSCSSILVLISFFVLAAHALDCTTNASGHVMTFNQIISSTGNYLLKGATVYSTEGNLLDQAPSTTAVVFELQLCQPITNSISSNCTIPDSIANMINPDGSCVSLGRNPVSIFNPNPYKDGVYIAAYNGSPVDHIQRYSVHIYLICDSTQLVGVPQFEHMKSTYQAHFSIATKLAC